MKGKWLGCLLLCLGLLLLGGCQPAAQDQPVKVYFFHNNPCESCDELGKLETLLQGLELPKDVKFELREYRAYSPEQAQAVKNLKAYLGSPQVIPYPLMVVGDRVLAGYEEIGQGFPQALEEAQKAKTVFDPSQTVLEEGEEPAALGPLREVDSKSSYGVLFVTEACGECRKAEEALALLPRELELEGAASPVEIAILSVAQPENAGLLKAFFESYRVPLEKQRVPVLFLRERWLSGAEAIEQEAGKALEAGEGLNFVYPEQEEEKGGLSFWTTAAVGFLNGWNPCALSMFLLLLSLVLSTGKGVRYGALYLCGKLLAYFGVGFALFRLAGAIDFKALSGIRLAGVLLLVLFCGVFALLNFLDFFAALRQEYGKLRLQLPEKLRALQQRLIAGAAKSGGKFPALVFLLLGAAVSAGEFLCTGQVYLATIFYLAQRGTGTLWHFALYAAAMCLPSALLLFWAGRGKRALELSEFSRKRLPWVKLATAMAFLAFLVLALCTL